jgi:hypothetical protein
MNYDSIGMRAYDDVVAMRIPPSTYTQRTTNKLIIKKSERALKDYYNARSLIVPMTCILRPTFLRFFFWAFLLFFSVSFLPSFSYLYLLHQSKKFNSMGCYQQLTSADRSKHNHAKNGQGEKNYCFKHRIYYSLTWCPKCGSQV